MKHLRKSCEFIQHPILSLSLFFSLSLSLPYLYLISPSLLSSPSIFSFLYLSHSNFIPIQYSSLSRLSLFLDLPLSSIPSSSFLYSPLYISQLFSLLLSSLISPSLIFPLTIFLFLFIFARKEDFFGSYFRRHSVKCSLLSSQDIKKM
jgi:hypothetical protein